MWPYSLTRACDADSLGGRRAAALFVLEDVLPSSLWAHNCFMLPAHQLPASGNLITSLTDAWLEDNGPLASSVITASDGSLASASSGKTWYQGVIAFVRFSALPLCVSTSRRWRRGVVVNDIGLIIEVNQRRARWILGWVTVFGRVNHLSM